MQLKWNYTPSTSEQTNAAKELGDKLSISPILASLLIRRGITTESAAKRFFRPQLSDLINPFLMQDMDIAVDRLNDAMGRKERIMVYGDYDVDGCTAVALVYKFLRQFYSNIDYYIPDRYDEGYGVSKKGIDFAKESGVKLIIILDCGIKAVEEISYAKEQGIDFIICDHHVPDNNMPPAVAILNPKRADDSFPFKDLCGCGVGFKFMQAFATYSATRFLRCEYRCRPCPRCRRKPYPCFPRLETAKSKSKCGLASHCRYLRTQRKGNFNERYYLQDRSTHKCQRPYGERKGKCRPACGTRFGYCAVGSKAYRQIQR